MTPKQVIESIDADNYDEAMEKIDEALALNLESRSLMHKLKFSMLLEHYKKINDNPDWIEQVPKKKAKEMFDIFLRRYELAFGKKFAGYDRMRREYHFKNWKVFLRTDFNKREKENE